MSIFEYEQEASASPMGQAALAPPHSLEAEQSVLGGILLSDRAMYGLVIEEGLKPEDFYRERHRLIYESMLALYRETELFLGILLALGVLGIGLLGVALAFGLILLVMAAIASIGERIAGLVAHRVERLDLVQDGEARHRRCAAGRRLLDHPCRGFVPADPGLARRARLAPSRQMGR